MELWICFIIFTNNFCKILTGQTKKGKRILQNELEYVELENIQSTSEG